MNSKKVKLEARILLGKLGISGEIYCTLREMC